VSSRSGWLNGRIHLLGASLPVAVALLIGAILVTSILGAQVQGWFDGGAFVPGLVWQGQAWRLVTWAFYEMHPLYLIFAALALFWFGNDLVHLWGPGRFLATYLGLAAAAAGVTCLLALVWSRLFSLLFVGAWPVISGLIIAWAIAFPTRNIFVYLVLPLHGRNLIYATLAGTLLFALLSGSIASYVPSFAAEFLALIAMRRRNPLSELWTKVKFELAYRRWRHRSSNLREVPRPRSRDEDPRWYH
jgi:membrane associated rhomboid family serine protease